MKKIALISAMALTLMLAAGIAFGSFTIYVPWFINDNGGVYQSSYDTWLTFRNVTSGTVLVTLDFYDNSDYLTIATTVTVELDPLGAKTYDTGLPARTDAGDSNAYAMGANCDRGVLNIWWTEVGTKPREDVLGYTVIQYWKPANTLQAQGHTIFLYAD